MSPKAHEVLEQARQLTEDERRALAWQLLEELDADGSDVEAAWTAEVDRRITEVNRGEVQTLSDEDAWKLIASND